MQSQHFKDQVIPLQNSLYRLANSMLHDRQEAEDVAQEIVIKLWSRKDSLEQINSIRAFALRMTKNLCLDKIKLRKKSISEIEKERLPERSSNPYQRIETSDLAHIIQTIMGFLPEQQKIVIHLRNIEELSIEEIAEVTEMTANHVRVTISRARQAINEIYHRHYDHE